MKNKFYETLYLLVFIFLTISLVLLLAFSNQHGLKTKACGHTFKYCSYYGYVVEFHKHFDITYDMSDYEIKALEDKIDKWKSTCPFGGKVYKK